MPFLYTLRKSFFKQLSYFKRFAFKTTKHFASGISCARAKFPCDFWYARWESHLVMPPMLQANAMPSNAACDQHDDPLASCAPAVGSNVGVVTAVNITAAGTLLSTDELVTAASITSPSTRAGEAPSVIKRAAIRLLMPYFSTTALITNPDRNSNTCVACVAVLNVRGTNAAQPDTPTLTLCKSQSEYRTSRKC